MPPENVFTSRSAASVEVEPLEQLVGPAAGRRAFDRWCRRPTITRFARAAHQPVDGGLLRGHADAPAHRGRIGHDVDAGDRGRALGGRRERGEDADGGGLAGAVVAEQAEDGAGRDVEVEVAQRPEVAVALAEAAGDDAAAALGGRAGGRSSVGMLYRCFVHSTTNLAVHCTNGKRAVRSTRPTRAHADGRPGRLRQPTRSPTRRDLVAEKVAEGRQAASKQADGRPRRRGQAEALDQLASHARRARRLDPHRAGRPPAPLHPRRHRGGRDPHRRRRGLRRGVDATHRGRARRRHDDALPLRAHQGRAAHVGHRRGHGRGRRARRRAAARPTGATRSP